MGDHLVTTDMGRKFGEGSAHFAWVGELGHHRTQCGLGRGYTSVLSGILIHPAVWPQYTNVTDRTDRQTGQDRQRSDSTGRTVLQTVAQKRPPLHFWRQFVARVAIFLVGVEPRRLIEPFTTQFVTHEQISRT